MTTRVRTGEKIYRGLFLELSPSVSFETAGHHDPDHVQSAGGREKEGFGRVGEVGERERDRRPQGGEKSETIQQAGVSVGEKRTGSVISPYTIPVYQREHSVGAESCGNYRARGVI